jgi:hypothetical protein
MAPKRFILSGPRQAVGGRLFRYAAIASASVRDKFEYERQGMAGASSRPSGRRPSVIAMTMSLTDHFPSPVWLSGVRFGGQYVPRLAE